MFSRRKGHSKAARLLQLVAFVCVVLLLRFYFSTPKVSNGQPQSIKYVLRENRPHRTYAIKRTKVFPRGGDEIKFDQPWTVPEIRIYESIESLIKEKDDLAESKNTKLIVSNFTYSPGLGNLMFQFAALRAVAEDVEASVVLPADCSLRRAFGHFGYDQKVVFVDPSALESFIRKNQGAIIDFKECCRYQPLENLFSDPKRRVEIVIGYFQSFRYFHPRHESLIRRLYTFLPGVVNRATSILDNIRYDAWNDYIGDKKVENDAVINLPEGSESEYFYVGVHARHGMDITMHSRNLRHGHTAAPARYYTTAMDKIQKDFPWKEVVFIVVTDDFPWAKRSLGRLPGKRVIFPRERREVDLALLTMCNATIISTGTYSWWGAYLGNGVVTRYGGWPVKGSELDYMLNADDYFPRDWLEMQ